MGFGGWRRGTSVERDEEGYQRRGSSAVDVAQRHNELQNELFRRLRAKHGNGAVVYEEGYVDVTLRLSDGTVDLFEVKSDDRPLMAIRAALEQLLWYRFQRLDQTNIRTLVIAAPAPLDDDSKAYLAHLREILSVDLRYLQIHPDIDPDSYQVP